MVISNSLLSRIKWAFKQIGKNVNMKLLLTFDVFRHITIENDKQLHYNKNNTNNAYIKNIEKNLIRRYKMAISAIIGSDSYNLMKEGIKAATIRGKAISNNIANINTKNYKRFNVIFEENINKRENSNLNLKTTNERHLKDSDTIGNITVKKDESTSMRTDGNNVDLDIEKVNQAANSLKYNALIQKANGKLSNIKYVISGGR